MTCIKVIYLATVFVMWFCIGVNLKLIKRNKKLSKDYLAAIEAARAAEKNFLEAADTYHTMCKELQGGTEQ